MKSYFAFAIALLVLSSTTALAFEVPLSAFGFEGADANAPLSRDCQTIAIDISSSAAGSETVGILSLRANFEAVKSDSSYVSVKTLAGTQLIWPENLLCAEGEGVSDGNCWARIFLPALSTKEVEAEICVQTGGETAFGKIFVDSFAGLYNSPRITITNSAPAEIDLGERAKLSTKIKNSGTKDALVFIQFVKPDTRAAVDITSFDIIDGQSTMNVLLTAGEEQEFSYYVKPSKASSYNLSSSIAVFENVFGEQQGVISNHAQMNVKELLQIELTLIGREISSKEFELKAIVKNNLSEPFNGTIFISPSAFIRASNQELVVGALNEKSVYFYSKELPLGEYSFTATIVDNNTQYASNTITVELKDQPVPFEIIFAIIGVIILAIFLYFIYGEREKIAAPQKKE